MDRARKASLRRGQPSPTKATHGPGSPIDLQSADYPLSLRYRFLSRRMTGLLQSHRPQSSGPTSETFPGAKVLLQGPYLRQQPGPPWWGRDGLPAWTVSAEAMELVSRGEHQQSNGRTKHVATQGQKGRCWDPCGTRPWARYCTSLSLSCSSATLCCEGPHAHPTGLWKGFNTSRCI